MMANVMRDWMYSPANPGNMYYSRRGQRGGGGGRRSKGGGGGAQDEATVNNTGNWNVNFEGPKFGDQTNLGRGDFGGMMPGGQGQQSTQSGAAPTQGQPPARNRPQLTPEQKQRNAETAKARRALASDIKKNGTEEQKQRVQTQGVAGGKTRQPRQTKATTAPPTSQQTTGSTFSNVSANSIQANQVSAGSMNVGAGATGGPQAAGAPFIDLGSVSGGSASSPSSGAKAQGGTIGGVKIN
jgi:hypothetical protein